MKRLEETSFTDLLTPVLAEEPKVKALGMAYGALVRLVIEKAKRAGLFAGVDTMPGELLDRMAAIWQTPFYSERYSLLTKRRMVKNSMLTYSRMGTVKACNDFLDTFSLSGYVEEWFEYEGEPGEPGHFRVVFESEFFREDVNAESVLRGLEMVKRFSAHLDEVEVRHNVSVGSIHVGIATVSAEILWMYQRD